MAERVILQKGEPVKLEKFPDLKRVGVALSWKKRLTSGEDLDLDMSIFILGKDGRLLQSEVFYDPSTPNEKQNLVWSDSPKPGYEHGKKFFPNFVFYYNLVSPGGAVVRTPDETKGGIETAEINLPKIPAEADKIVFIITIYDAVRRKQNFGQVEDAEISFKNLETGEQMFFIDLDEDHPLDTAVHGFTLYRNNAGGFSVKNVSEGHVKGLDFFTDQYGLTA